MLEKLVEIERKYLDNSVALESKTGDDTAEANAKVSGNR